jgi:hypothetical protein
VGMMADPCVNEIASNLILFGIGALRQKFLNFIQVEPVVYCHIIADAFQYIDCNLIVYWISLR